MTEPAYRLVRAPRPALAAPGLDDAQRAVVEHAGGPLLVLAGPGTGKTTTLVESVVERVARGVPVKPLLMLTFSRRAAGPPPSCGAPPPAGPRGRGATGGRRGRGARPASRSHARCTRTPSACF